MSACPVCGAAMVQFRNPDREICTKSHARIEAEKRQHTRKGEANKGQKRPKSAGNLKRGKK